MKILYIATSRTPAGFSAWLDTNPRVKATSTGSEYQAAENLAVRLFVGHNHFAQISEEVLSRIAVTRTGAGRFRATFEG